MKPAPRIEEKENMPANVSIKAVESASPAQFQVYALLSYFVSVANFNASRIIRKPLPLPRGIYCMCTPNRKRFSESIHISQKLPIAAGPSGSGLSMFAMPS